MRLDRETFEGWAKTVSPASDDYSLSKVALSAGIPKSSLLYQARRGYIEASVVIAYSRGLGINPLDQLLRFEQFAIYADTAAPSQREILTQLPPESYMQELLNRLHGTTIEIDIGQIPAPYAMKRWLDSYNLWGQYDQLSERLGFASRDRLSERISRNRLTLGELVLLTEIADLTPRFGLVVAGLLSLEEANYPSTLWETTLAATESAELVDVLGDSLRWLTKRIEDLEPTSPGGSGSALR